MIYQWKIPGLIPVDAQVAGEELDRIYTDRGRLDVEDVVDESRPESAPLHNCFEWDDAVAAEEYRKTQAGMIIRHITTIVETENHDPVPVRAYVHAQESYRPIQVVIHKEDMKLEMMRNAMRELDSFKNKYETLESLRPVFEAIDFVQIQRQADTKETTFRVVAIA